jgi:hypothetical protein
MILPFQGNRLGENMIERLTQQPIITGGRIPAIGYRDPASVFQEIPAAAMYPRLA